MTPAIIGKKIGMTRVYDADGRVVPVTVVEAQPNAVAQVKTVETDGYNAVQIAGEPCKARHSTMPLIGHAAKSGLAPHRRYREIRETDAPEVEPGQAVDVSMFAEVLFVDVTGTSKGKGTQGVMRRHGFGGQPASHGTERKHRSPGSIASRSSDAGRGGKPKKGLKMAGHTGMDRITTRNHPLVAVDTEKHLLLIKGALPGPNGGMLFVKKSRAAGKKEKAAAAKA